MKGPKTEPRGTQNYIVYEQEEKPPEILIWPAFR
jgi:hypothetical protein